MSYFSLDYHIRKGNLALPLMGFGGDPDAAFPEALLPYLEVEVDRDGTHVAFACSVATGELSWVVGDIHNRLQAIRNLRGVALREETAAIAAFVAERQAKYAEADRLWTAHIDGRRARRDAA